jgi:DNA-nicking Smr family endonuclease
LFAQDRKLGSPDRYGLDASWDRKLSRGLVAPDFTLDLHGATLDAAHGRLEHGLTLALGQGARLVLLITGRHRASDDRMSRGVIRRKFMDWLTAGPHSGRIAAVRPAHSRHGGAGAVYIVLRKPR